MDNLPILSRRTLMSTKEEKCIYCERNSDEVPLLALSHRGQALWICPQHLPILIHKPEQLADRLPGAANLGVPEGH
jgi:hypothetical protein